MKLMEASAVFLIIGGVLLGLIEVRDVYTGTTACGVVVEEGVRKYNCLPSKHETTGETCERAMREIGAETLPVLNTLILGHGRGGHHEGGPYHKSTLKWFIDGTKVLCFPAPSGLRRDDR